ncbi:hypothetical protein [Xanthobacter agilis]|uniref:Uncharacterized protein n=1 Tax=Xanthobacter agilis TaxID=47492 RepID=A0ABU0LHF5_XANAG|nr:hypothetical protein [Xanthobacter agilis]MDQ0506555.1 hypothetical protein [Xanthobacter agilis]
MRAPFSKAPAPRIRALGGAPSRAKAQSPASHGPASQGSAPTAGKVFRDFVATLEKLDTSRRRKTPGASGGEG